MCEHYPVITTVEAQKKERPAKGESKPRKKGAFAPQTNRFLNAMWSNRDASKLMASSNSNKKEETPLKQTSLQWYGNLTVTSVPRMGWSSIN